MPAPSDAPSSHRSRFDPDDPVRVGPDGLDVPSAGVTIDPWSPVDRAIVTHAHADHAVRGCGAYLCTPETGRLIEARHGGSPTIDALPYGERRTVGDVVVSLHPAGHVLGSAQVRLETPRGTWVVSGDYGVHANPTCAAFEPVPCDVFISECTFGLPIYRWPDPAQVAADIDAWWRANAAEGRTSVVFAYALGKAQRVLAMVDRSIGPILVHGAMRRIGRVYEACGVDLPESPHATKATIAAANGRALVVAPPSAAGSPWLRRFEPVSTAFASGWMRVRGMRRRRGADRGFVLSDHADWPGLLQAIEATGASRVGVTHGSVEVMARHLAESGRQTAIYPTRYEAAPDTDADATLDGDARDAGDGETPDA